MKKHITLLGLTACLCFICTGCGTSALTNAQAYKENVNSILSIVRSSTENEQSSTAVQDTLISLDAPSDFAMEDDGTFSFSSVENAGYYVLYFCDPESSAESEEYLYESTQILSLEGESICSGFYRDVIDVPYGEYLVKVVAFPELGSTTYTMSGMTEGKSFTAMGEQSAPAFDYFWDSFTETLSFQLSNVSTYSYEAYPAQVDITIVNVNDNDDQTVVVLENVSEENIEVATTELTMGETYSITAMATSSSAYVTNTDSDVGVVADSLTLGELNVLTSGYTYSSSYCIYPLIWEGFDLTAGGSVGELMGFNGLYSYICTPTVTTDGSAYSYTVSVNPFVEVPGGLELYEDGTAYLYLTGYGPVSASSITGEWINAGDGTAILNFSFTSWS